MDSRRTYDQDIFYLNGYHSYNLNTAIHEHNKRNGKQPKNLTIFKSIFINQKAFF